MEKGREKRTKIRTFRQPLSALKQRGGAIKNGHVLLPLPLPREVPLRLLTFEHHYHNVPISSDGNLYPP